MATIAIDPRYRITSGGSFKDFEDVDEAIEYMKKMTKRFLYASINKVYTFKKSEDD